MSVVEKAIEVDAPVRAVYNQWTQFEDFPRFMEGVESVEQLNDTTLRWNVEIGGVNRTFEAHIQDQEPDRRIAWRATEGEGQGQEGVVTFEPVDGARTRVSLRIAYEPEGLAEKAADFFNVIERRTEGDLERFKEYIEERGGQPTGAWRGEVGGASGGTGSSGAAGRSSAAAGGAGGLGASSSESGASDPDVSRRP